MKTATISVLNTLEAQNPDLPENIGCLKGMLHEQGYTFAEFKEYALANYADDPVFDSSTAVMQFMGWMD